MARSQPRDVTIQIRVTQKQKQQLKAKAKKEKDTVSNLLYPLVLELLPKKPEAVGFLDD